MLLDINAVLPNALCDHVLGNTVSLSAVMSVHQHGCPDVPLETLQLHGPGLSEELLSSRPWASCPTQPFHGVSEQVAATAARPA